VSPILSKAAAEMKNILNFSDLLEPRAGRPIPLPAIFLALAATALLILELPSAVDPRSRLVGSLATAWLASLAGGRLAAALRWSRPADLGIQAAAAALAAAAIWFARPIDLFLPTFIAGLALAGVATPLPALTDARSYWAWLEKLVTAAQLPLAATLVGFAAVSATIWSAQLLFGLFLTATIEAMIWRSAVILFVAVAPILFVLRAPPVHMAAPEEREEDFFRRLQALVANWALAPFVLGYSALLWAYGAKIALAWTLPLGEVGRMVAGFGLAATLTIFLIFPYRERGPVHVRLLWRIWPYLLPAPLILVACALFERIDVYGLTADRYIAVLLACLCAAGGAVALTDRDRYIRFAPAAAAVALILASLGPFGAVESSIRWQKASLEAVMTAHGLLKDGRLPSEIEPASLTETESRRWSSAIELLRRYDRLPSFGLSESSAGIAKRLSERVRLAESAKPDRRAHVRFPSFDDNAWVASADLEPYSIVGRLVFAGDSERKSDALRVAADGFRLSIARGEAAPTVFDLAELARRVETGAGRLVGPLTTAPADGSAGLLLLVEAMNLRIDDKERKLVSMRALLLERRVRTR
jgi:hypothetical protein